MFAAMPIEMLAWSKGLFTSAGLIIAIGAQNAFLLTQSIRRQFHWPVALLCIFFDVVLISVGVAGLGAILTESDLLMEIARWSGILFLLWYSFGAGKRALSKNRMETGAVATSLKSAVLTTLAVTLLNPHVYLDTVVLLGSIGGQYSADLRLLFSAGAITFSAVWFCSLTIGARWLTPLFKRPAAWRVMDSCVCLMMLSIATSLFLRGV